MSCITMTGNVKSRYFRPLSASTELGLIGRPRMCAVPFKNYCSESIYPISTIYAVSSGHGKCGVCVIRITGPASRDVVCLLTGRKNPPVPRKAVLSRVVHPVTKTKIDHGLVLWFPGK